MSIPIYGDINLNGIKENLDERTDINANAVSPYLKAEDNLEFIPKEANGIETSSPDYKSKPPNVFLRVIESLKNIFGNYILNNDGDIEITTYSNTLEPDETQPGEGSDDSNPVDGLEDQIEDEEFRLTHGGLSREEWNELIQWLRDNGMGWLADALEHNPDCASEILDIISDPEGYWDSLGIEAGENYAADEEKRAEVLEKILEALGLTEAHIAGYHGRTVYTDGEGNYYFVSVSEDGVRLERVIIMENMYGDLVFVGRTHEYTTYDLSDPMFGLSAGEIAAYDSIETRMEKLHAENMNRLGLPEDWDPRDVELTEEQEAFLDGMKEDMWLQQDGDYLYIDPRFFEFMERLTRLYNILTVIFILTDAKMKMKRITAEFANEIKLEDDGPTVMETIESKKSNAMSRMKYQLYTLQRYVATHNQRVYQQKLQDAMRKARKKARKGWGGFCNWTSMIISFGGSDAIDRDTNRRYYGYKESIDREYEEFQTRVEQQYEGTLGSDLSFDSGDPFGLKIDEIMDTLSLENFKQDVTDYGFWNIRDVGGRKYDLNKNNVVNQEGTGLRNRLVALENLRKLWYSLKQAKKKLKETCFEAVTGKEIGTDTQRVIIGTLSELNQFEQSLVSNIIGQMQAIMTAHNAAVDARYYKNYWATKYAAGITAGLCGPFSYLALPFHDLTVEVVFAYLNNSANFERSDLQVDADSLYRDMAEAKTEAGKRILSSDEEAALAIDELEKKQWEIIATLEYEGIIKRSVGNHGEEIWCLNEPLVNELRAKLTALQNLQRLIAMLVRTKLRVREIMAKISRGEKISDLGNLGADTFDPISDNQRLAFELKLSTLRNKINENNRQTLDEARSNKTAVKAWGTAVGIMVSIALIVAFPGVGVFAALGLVMALGMLGQSLANIAYQAGQKTDMSAFQRDDFYALKEMELTGELEADLINKLEQRTKEQIDLITKDAHKDIGTVGITLGDQWGLDASVFLDVSNEVKKWQIIERVVVMLSQAKQDIRNVILATTTGTSSGDQSDLVRSTFQATHKDQIGAIGLKREMVMDFISAHNRKVMIKEEMTRSGITAGVSAVSAAAGGIGAAACQGGMNAIQGVMKGFEVAAYINTAINLAFSVYDAFYSGYGNINKSEIDEILKEVYKTDRRTKTSVIEEAERNAVASMGYDMVVGMGGGNIGINIGAFYRLRQEIESLYNIYMSMIKVAQARGKIMKKLLQRLGMATAADDSSALEAIYRMKDNALKNLNILRMRVQTYVDRKNQMNEAMKNFYINLAVAIIVAAVAFMRYVPVIKKAVIGKNGKMTYKRIPLMKALDNWLRKTFGKMATSKKLLNPNKNPLHALAGAFIGGEGSFFDGKFGVGDFAGMAVQVLLSQNFARLLAAAIYNETHDNAGDAKPQKSEGRFKSKSSSSSSIDYYDQKASQEEIALGNIEVQSEKEQILQALEDEIHKLAVAVANDARKGIGRVRQSGDNAKAVIRTLEKSLSDKKQTPEQIAKGLLGKKPAEIEKILKHLKANLSKYELEALKRLEKVIAKIEVSQTQPQNIRTLAREVRKAAAAAIVAAQKQVQNNSVNNNNTHGARGTGKVAQPSTVNRSDLHEKIEKEMRAYINKPGNKGKVPDNLVRAAMEVKVRAAKANQASQQFDAEATNQQLAGVKGALQKLATLIPAGKNPVVAKKLLEIRKKLRNPKLKAEELQEIVKEIKDAAKDLKLNGVQEYLQKALVELESAIDNLGNIKEVEKKQKTILKGLKDGVSAKELAKELLDSKKPQKAILKIVDNVCAEINKSPAKIENQKRLVAFLAAVAESLPEGQAKRRVINRIEQTLNRMMIRDKKAAEISYQDLPDGIKKALSPAIIKALSAAGSAVNIKEEKIKKHERAERKITEEMAKAKNTPVKSDNDREEFVKAAKEIGNAFKKMLTGKSSFTEALAELLKNNNNNGKQKQRRADGKQAATTKSEEAKKAVPAPSNDNNKKQKQDEKAKQREEVKPKEEAKKVEAKVAKTSSDSKQQNEKEQTKQEEVFKNAKDLIEKKVEEKAKSGVAV